MAMESSNPPPEVNDASFAVKIPQADATTQETTTRDEAQIGAGEFTNISKLLNTKLSEMSIKEILIMVAAFIYVSTAFLLKLCFKAALAICTLGISLLIERNIKRSREQKEWDEKYANADESTRAGMDYMRAFAEKVNADRALANAQRLQEAREKSWAIYERNRLNARLRKQNDFQRQMLRYQRTQANIAKKRWALTKNEVKLNNYGRNSVWGRPFKNPAPNSADLLEDMVIYDNDI